MITGNTLFKHLQRAVFSMLLVNMVGTQNVAMRAFKECVFGAENQSI